MEPLGIDERREVWGGHVGSRENSRRVTGFPGIEERRGATERRGGWGARRIRGASRVSRDAPSVGGFGGPDEFEARHGFPGTRRASGGLGGPIEAPHEVGGALVNRWARPRASVKPSTAACRQTRRTGSVVAPNARSPTIGWPSAASWARIWPRRPVRRRNSSTVERARRSRTRHSTTAT